MSTIRRLYRQSRTNYYSISHIETSKPNIKLSIVLICSLHSIAFSSFIDVIIFGVLFCLLKRYSVALDNILIVSSHSYCLKYDARRLSFCYFPLIQTWHSKLTNDIFANKNKQYAKYQNWQFFYFVGEQSAANEVVKNIDILCKMNIDNWQLSNFSAKIVK